MRIALAADHAGFTLKERLRERLTARGEDVLNLGAHDAAPSDYADFELAVGTAVAEGRADRGIGDPP